jgi:hypothetical protein
MTSDHMTIGEFIELLLDGELNIERLKRFGNKLDEFRQKYSLTRIEPNFDRQIEYDIDELSSHLRGGLPHMIEKGLVSEQGDILTDTPEESIRDFMSKISSDTLSFTIIYATREEIKQALC